MPRGRTGHATIVAYLALFVALGETGAYAIDKIDGDDIGKRSIPGNRLERGSVGTKEARNPLAEDFNPNPVIGSGRVTADKIGTLPSVAVTQNVSQNPGGPLNFGLELFDG